MVSYAFAPTAENDYTRKVQDCTERIKFAECPSCTRTEEIQRLFIIDPTTDETIVKDEVL